MAALPGLSSSESDKVASGTQPVWPLAFVGLGLVIAGTAAFADALNVGVKRHMGPVQWAGVAIGLGLALVAWMTRRRADGAWGRGLLLVLSVLCTVGCIELGLRTYAQTRRLWPSLLRPSQCCVYENVPGLDGYGPLGEKVTINAAGARDDREYLGDGTGRTRIAFVGDSMTFGLGLELEDTYVKRTGTKVQRAVTDGTTVETLNFGLIGANPLIEAEHVRHRVLPLAPRVVVFQVFADDFGELRSDFFAKVRQGNRAKLPFVERGLLTLTIAQKAWQSWAGPARRQDQWIQSVEKRLDHLERKIGWILEHMRGDIPEHSRRLTTERLTAMIDDATARGITSVVLVIPDIVQVGRPQLQRITAIFRGIASRTGAAFVDVTGAFEAHPGGVGPLYLLPADAHLSAAGAEVAAEQLHLTLMTLLARGRPSATGSR